MSKPKQNSDIENLLSRDSIISDINYNENLIQSNGKFIYNYLINLEDEKKTVFQAPSEVSNLNVIKKTETYTSINESLEESEIRKYSSEDSFVYKSSVIKESKSEF